MTTLGLEWEVKYAAVNESGSIDPALAVSADLVTAVTAKKLRILAFVGVLGGADATFKFQTGASTDISGVFQHALIPAIGTLTLAANAGNTETVVLDSKTYTFQTTLTDVDGNVKIGASASDSLDNLIAAITLGAGGGTTYAASMTLHPTITAIAGTGDTMIVTAKVKGVGGNSIATTETLANASSVFATATLASGMASAQLFVLPYNPAGWAETVAAEKLNVVLTGASATLDGMLTYAEVT